LATVKLTVWKVIIERVTVVKFRMNNGGGNGAGCFEVKVWWDTVKFTVVIVARFRKCIWGSFTKNALYKFTVIMGARSA